VSCRGRLVVCRNCRTWHLYISMFGQSVCLLCNFKHQWDVRENCARVNRFLTRTKTCTTLVCVCVWVCVVCVRVCVCVCVCVCETNHIRGYFLCHHKHNLTTEYAVRTSSVIKWMKWYVASSPSSISRGAEICQNSSRHLQILGARRVTWGKFHNENPQFCSDLWTLLLCSALCLVYVIW
jgi:hypothetical protein